MSWEPHASAGYLSRWFGPMAHVASKSCHHATGPLRDFDEHLRIANTREHTVR
jgi:hypothetical protein